LGPEEEVYKALLLGTSDYFGKNGFQHAVLGLSGGVDSALALALAVDALGSDAVTAVSMPSRFTSAENQEDAAELARRFDVEFIEVAIDGVYDCYLDSLAQPFAGAEPNVAEENIQARIRGNILMALSNKFGWLVIATGNKSEMSVGYATLYGDMAGGFAILKDVPKTWVYRLTRWRNTDAEVIPQRVIDKPPSADLSHRRDDRSRRVQAPPGATRHPHLNTRLRERPPPPHHQPLPAHAGIVNCEVRISPEFRGSFEVE
jgi:NAD+ synthase (glutamine-hydrolysing)